jgi:hypothetical protein
MPAESVAHKIAVADCVVIGKIVAMAEKPVAGQLWRYSETPQWEFTVVEVEVTGVLAGPADVKLARFGFMAARLEGGSYDPKPAVGQRGCFFGVKIGKNDFYVIPTGGYIEEHGKPYERDVASARRAGRLLANLRESLQAKDQADRVTAAHLLLLRNVFTPFRHGETGKAEPIDAELSKLALLALAEGDWEQHSAEVQESLATFQWGTMHGGPAPKGFPEDRKSATWTDDAKTWLRDNSEKFRLYRIVKGK